MILSLEKLSRIILASSSPRRKDILQSIGLKVEIVPSTFEENLNPDEFLNLEDFAVETSLQKALEVAERLKRNGETADLVVAADTIVAFEGKVYGKPLVDDRAREMLQKLSGQCHEAMTGVTLLWKVNTDAEFVEKFCEVTKVHLGVLSDAVISAYIQTKEPLDKAGAYGIQGIGGSLIRKIDGDFYNVAGFPLYRFCQFVNKYYDDCKTESVN